MIINVGRNLINRARLLTTKQDVNIDDVCFAVLRKNDFPPRVIRRLLSVDAQRQSGRIPDARVNLEGRFHSITYVRGAAEKLRKKFAEFTDERISFKPARKVNEFFTKLKDPVPKDLRSDVVYSIPCKDCNLCYIGTTAQSLRRRLQKHKSEVRLGNNTTALCSHALGGHEFDFDNTKIIDYHQVYGKRMLLESLHIKRNLQNTVNRRADIAGVHNAYTGLLN